MTKTFQELHPDVYAMNAYEIRVRRYRDTTMSGRIIEAWDMDDDGVWHDVTLREQTIQQAELELAKAKRDLRRACKGDDDDMEVDYV